MIPVFSGLVLLSWSSAVDARAEAESPSAPTLQELADSYGVAKVPAEILAVVDTSDSMVTDGHPPPWPQVVTGYRALIDAASDYDEPALITFSDVANMRWRPVPLSSAQTRAEAKAALPLAKPRGPATDIGAGLDAAVALLRAAGSPQIQTMVFITDGKHNPPAGSPYQGTTGGNWGPLRLAAQRLQAAHGDDLSVYAYGLGPTGGTDVGIVKSIFPRTQIVSFPTSQLAEFIKDLAADALRARVRPEVVADLRTPVTASLTAGSLSNDTEATLTMANPRKGLPATVDLRSIRVTDADGDPVPIDLTTGPITLAPGQRSDLSVVLHPANADHGFSWGEKVDTRTWNVVVEASSGVPKPMATLLGTEELADKGQLSGSVENLSPTVQASTAYGVVVWKLVVALLVVLAIVAAVIRFFYWLSVRPPLTGMLERLDPDGEYRVISCPRGKDCQLPGDLLDVGDSPDSLRLFTKTKSRAGVVYAQRLGGAPRLNGQLLSARPRRLAGGVLFNLGDTTVRYSKTKS